MYKKNECKISARELALLFGADENDHESICQIVKRNNANLNYFRPDQEKRDELLLESLRVLVNRQLKTSGESRHGDWESGWLENLTRLQSSPKDLASALLPGYVRPNAVNRLQGDYACFQDELFEKSYIEIFRTWLFQKYFSECCYIKEFGCGSGSHIYALSQLFPKAQIHGYDWSLNSVKICEVLSEQVANITGGTQFDFFSPLFSENGMANTGVLTFGALEQTGARFKSFIDSLCEQKPDVCVHVEGIDELYNPDLLFDYIALQYNSARGYLTGLLSYLLELEKVNKAKILKVHRHHFGSRFNDTVSYIVWKPL